ncbi:MAG: DUF2334 domain-containing protein [Promethearchaeota archaeon]
MNFKKSLIYPILRKFSKLEEKTMHVEAFVRDDLWNNLKSLIGKNFIWFVITPANYNYCKCYFNLKMTKEEFSLKLANRIKFLKELNEEIQLHIHLCNIKEFLDTDLQDDKFKESMEFLNDLNIKPTKFVAGWFTYDDYTLTIAKKYGIDTIYDYNVNPRKKDYLKNNILIKYVYKFWHDYDFI